MSKKLKFSKLPKLRIVPKKQTKKERDAAKLLEEFINIKYQEHSNLLSAISRKQILFYMFYGFELPSDFFDTIIQAVVLDDNNELRRHKSKKKGSL